MIDFFGMGGYAAYVWSAYGITLAVLLANVWAAKRLLAKNLDGLRGSIDSKDGSRQPTVRRM